MPDRDEWLAQCRRYCRDIKYLGERLEWDERPTHSGTLAAKSILLDAQRIAIPKLFFQGEYQEAAFGTLFRCKVMHSEAGQTLKVFMLEVYPEHKLSHREPGLEIHGPHVHLGDRRVGSALVRALNCGLDQSMLTAWIERFRRHARILDDGDAKLSPPFAGELF